MEKEYLRKNICKQKKKKVKSAPKNLKNYAEDSETMNDENLCIDCIKPFGNSKAKEVWVKFTLCSLWAHQACTPELPTFICQHCESD